jgi:hypothetical protein
MHGRGNSARCVDECQAHRAAQFVGRAESPRDADAVDAVEVRALDVVVAIADHHHVAEVCRRQLQFGQGVVITWAFVRRPDADVGLAPAWTVKKLAESEVFDDAVSMSARASPWRSTGCGPQRPTARACRRFAGYTSFSKRPMSFVTLLVRSHDALDVVDVDAEDRGAHLERRADHRADVRRRWVARTRRLRTRTAAIV